MDMWRGRPALRVPDFRQFVEWLQGAGLFIAGLVVGAAVYMSLYVENFDYLVQQNELLKEENSQLEERIETQSQVKNPTQLKSIEIIIQNPPSFPDLDNVTVSQLQKLTREELKFMIGQEVKALEPVSIKRLFGKKVFTTEDAKSSYVVEINSLFIADNEMRIWIQANHYMPSG